MNQKLIVGSAILTMNPSEKPIQNGAIAIENGKITDIGQYQILKSKYSNFEELGDLNTYVLPAFVNAHYHIARTFRNGLSDEPLELWLVGANSEEGGDAEFRYLNAAYSAIELLKSGTTTVLDHFYGNDRPPYFGADIPLQAYRDAAMKVTLSLAVRDQNKLVYGFSGKEDNRFSNSFPQEKNTLLKEYGVGGLLLESDDYFLTWKRLFNNYNSDPNVKIALGPAGLQWCSDDLMKKISAVSEEYNARVHTHLVESKLQREYAYKAFGKSAVEHLEELGFLSPLLSIAHCVWVNSRDIEILANRNVSIAHNPSSNLRLYAGIAPIIDMIKQNLCIGIGTDGMGFNDDNDHFSELRLCSLLQRVPGIGSKGLMPQKILEMATCDAAMSAGWGDQLGTISIGKRADVLLINSGKLQYPYGYPGTEPAELIVQRATKENISAVLSDGEIIVKDGKVLSLDEHNIVERLKEKIEIIWSKTPKNKQDLLLDVKEKLENYFVGWEKDGYPANYQYNTK